jgi:hypothetical protein
MLRTVCETHISNKCRGYIRTTLNLHYSQALLQHDRNLRFSPTYISTLQTYNFHLHSHTGLAPPNLLSTDYFTKVPLVGGKSEVNNEYSFTCKSHGTKSLCRKAAFTFALTRLCLCLSVLTNTIFC